MTNTTQETFGGQIVTARTARIWAREGFSFAQANACRALGLTPWDARERISYLLPERRDQLGLTDLGL